MTTMYALPALTVWDQSTVGGWSNTSGGVSNGTFPGSGDSIVFDTNSGSARTITVDGPSGGGTCANLTVSSSNLITFAFSGTPVGCTGDILLSGNCSIAYLSPQGGVAQNLTQSSGASITTFLCSKSAGATLTLLSNLVVGGSFTHQGTSSNFNANGFNVTANDFTIAHVSATLNMGSGTWTCVGGGGALWSVTQAGTISGASSTLKFTGNLGTPATFSDIAGGTKTYGTIWNATNGLGTNDFTFTQNAVPTITTFKIGPNSRTKFQNSKTWTATNWVVDATGGTAIIGSDNGGVNTTIAKAGGGTVYMDYVNLTRVTASPGSTFFARNSVDGGNNTNWTFVPTNTRFASFF